MMCNAQMESMQVPGHVHVCGGEHDAGDHMCLDATCRRWFWANAAYVPPAKVKKVRPRRGV